MSQINELRAKLDKVYGMETESAVEYLIGIYKESKSLGKALGDIEEEVKAQIADIMEETGQLEWKTESGKCIVTSSSVSVRYDTDALDALIASDPGIARLLTPHRKVSQRAGSMRIS